MFSNCSSLESLNISFFDTSGLIKMDYMFGYSGIKSLDLSSFNTLNIKTFKGVFEECQGLNVTLDENNCTNLIANIPEYVNVIKL